MKFDTIIIGGGLSGLTCGIRLQKAGQRCCIVSSGQSAMHFFSGGFDLLCRLPDGTEVHNPLESMEKLPESHPYSVIGMDKVRKYAEEAPKFLESCGIKTTGSHQRNSWRITPTGERKLTWLTIDGFTSLSSGNAKMGDKALIVNILGYLDFNTSFLADSFEKNGTGCRLASVRLEEMERLRKNPSEMRATNIARVMDRDEIWKKAAEQVKDLLEDEDLVVLPAVFGLSDSTITDKIQEVIGVKTIFITTMPPSVPGIRSQMRLKKEFEKSGGTFLLGDTAVDAERDEEGNISSIGTVNLGDIRLHADNFVLASGSFFSKGLIASPENIYEPVFGTDLDSVSDRGLWFDRSFWKRQDYISFGTKTDERLRASIGGITVGNLYAIGSNLGGSNTLYEGCGGGISLITALAAADTILEKMEERR